MTDTPRSSNFDPEAYASVAATMLALPQDPAWMPAIVANLRVLWAAADLIGTFHLPDETEAAPIFTA